MTLRILAGRSAGRLRMGDTLGDMINGFKEFIMKGNVIDLAVAVIIGGAFGAVVNALVNNVLMPFIAGLVGSPNFDSFLLWNFNGNEVAFGVLLTAIVNFLLIASAIYCRGRGPDEPPDRSAQPPPGHQQNRRSRGSADRAADRDPGRAAGRQPAVAARQPANGWPQRRDAADVTISRRRAGSRARCCFTVRASSSAVACAVAMSAASTITRTTGSVPDGRSSTRPVSPNCAEAARRPSASAWLVLTRALVHVLDVDQDLGQLGHHAWPAPSAACPVWATCAASCRPVSTPSPVVA